MKRPTWQQGDDGRCLLVPPPVITETREGFEYTFSVWMERAKGDSHLLQSVTYAFNLPAPSLSDTGTAALTSVLLPAMRMGLPVRIEAPVCRKYLENVAEYQDVFSTWLEDLHPVEIEASLAEEPSASAMDERGVGCFFSLGVDSFHTLLRHQDEISGLIFIHGFDIDLDRHAHRAAVHDTVSATAQSFGKKLITAQTNVRSFSDAYLWWGHYGASALGSIAQLLSGQFAKVYISSSNCYKDQFISGTNSLTDPLLTTANVQVSCDGTEFNRMEKTAGLAKDQQALNHLRVCWEMEGSKQNCGRCDKCLRTMSMLHLLGMLDRAPGFPQEINLDAVRRMRLLPLHLGFYDELCRKAREIGLENSPLMKAWDECALHSGDYRSAKLDATFLKSLAKPERDLLFDDLLVHAPRAVEKAVSTHASRSRGEVFDYLCKNHRRALWKAIRQGRV